MASTNKQSVQSVVVSARGAGDAASVLAQVAQALNVANAEVQTILAQVVQLALTGQEVYLLVDDAEQLDESALQALLELAAGVPEGRPHVFLFGEPSLIAALEGLDADGERFHVIELAPYSEEETREYRSSVWMAQAGASRCSPVNRSSTSMKTPTAGLATLTGRPRYLDRSHDR